MADKIKGITIEIGGDTQKLNKALEGVNKQSRDLQSELKQVERLLKLDPGNTELLAQKQKLLADAVANTKEKLDILKEAERQVAEQFKAGKVGEEQYRAIQREVIATEQQLKSLQQQLKEVNNGWKDAAEAIKKFGDKTVELGKGMTATVAVPIAGAATAAMAAWSEVDEALDTIIKKTGYSSQMFEELGIEETFRNLAKTLPLDLQSIGQAIGEVNARFQVTGHELEDLSTAFLQFANVHDTDLSNAIEKTQKIMAQWNIDTSKANELLGVLSNEAHFSGISVETLMDSVQKNGAVFKELGFSLEDSIALLGEFEQNGINTEVAITALRRAMVTFSKDGKSTAQGLKETTEAIKKAKTETEALKIAAEVFGTKGATEMVKAIREGRLELDQFGLEMGEFRDYVALTFEDTLDPVDDFTVAMNNLKLVGADIGSMMQEVVAPILEQLVAKLQGFADWFRNLSPEMQRTIIMVGGVAAAIGPLLIVVGKLAAALSAIIGLFGGASAAAAGTAAAASGAAAATGGLSGVIAALTGPVGLIIAAIAGLVAIIIRLWKTNEEFRENVRAVWEKIKEIFNLALEALKKLITSFYDGLKSWWNTHSTEVLTVLSRLWDTIAVIFNTALEVIRGVLDVFIGLFTGDWERMSEGVKRIWTSLWEGIRDIVAGAWNILKGAFNILWGSISGWFNDLINSAFSWGKNLIGGFIDGIKSMINGVKNAVKSVVNTVSDFLGFHSPAKKGEGRYIVDWGANMIAGFIEGMNKALPELQKSARNIMPVIKNEIVNTTQIDYSKIPKGDTYIYVYNPQPSPAELARQIKKEQQLLALGF